MQKARFLSILLASVFTALFIRPHPSLFLENDLSHPAWFKKVGDLNQGVVGVLHLRVGKTQPLPLITRRLQRLVQANPGVMERLPPRPLQGDLGRGMVARRQCLALCHQAPKGIRWRLRRQVNWWLALPYRTTGAVDHAFMPLLRQPAASF